MKKETTEWRCLLWYDGPHVEIRGERESTPHDPGQDIVEIIQWAAEIADCPPTEPTRVTLRLSRDTLEAMLALLDSEPVDDEPDGEYAVPEWSEAE